ncbi:MAG TPA: MFS transporter [Candidatus Sulfotelmatobacter sp.]|nr:MFS transporter [Candidatus Sulfotelmatobacter sp.]
MAAASIPVSDQSLAKPAHPLRERNFQLLLTGGTISLLGDQCYLVALPWLVLQMTGSAVAMGTILMAAAIPRAVLMLMGGAISDRMSPRKIMMATAWARTFFVAAIAILVWLHVLRLWELYALSFAFGVADAFSFPARQAFVPSLVKREQLVQANAALQSTAQLTTIAGPAPAGIAIKVLGTAWAFFLDAISFLFIIAALWFLPDPPVQSAAKAKRSMLPSILEGLAYVRRDVPLRSMMLLAAIMNLCISGPMGVGLPYLTKNRFGSATAYGIAVSAAAAGGLVGSLLAGVWRVQRRGLLIVSISVAIAVCLGPLGFLPHLWMIAAALLLMGASAGLVNVHIGSWIQQRIEPAVRGRVMSVLMLAAFGLLPVSLAAAGFLIAWNLRGMFVLAAVLLVIVAATAALQKSVREIA